MAANRGNNMSLRLNEAFAHLWVADGIRSVSDFARALDYDRTYISNAMNGKFADFPPAIFTRLCQRYPGVFDVNYLLTGEGYLLLKDAPGASGGSAERDATIEALEELVDTQRVLIEALRERLRSLGVEYIATVKPMHSRAYDTPASTPFVASAAEPSDQSSEPSAPARIKQETSTNVSPKRKRKSDN